MCGKGSQTTTQQTSQTSKPNPQAMQLYQNLLTRAQGVSNTPYQPYGGELVAPVNQQQGTGIANINNWQPAFGTAEGMAYNAAQPITAGQIQQYESPYTQGVVNATQAEFNNQNNQQQASLLGNAAAQGALGGNRVGVAQAQLANQQQLAQAPVIANLQNQGYMTGLNTALTEQQAQAQGAYGVANMAQAGLQGANAQIGAGTLEQQTQQAQDTAQYQQYLNQLGYPFQTTQWLAGIGTGVGSQMGGTTTGYGTTTGPAPSMLGQLGGIGTLAAGLGGQAGLFSSLGSGMSAALPFLASIARGGRVNGYAAGGGVAGPQYPVAPESHHTLRAQQRQLVAGDRHVQMFPQGVNELPLPHGMKKVYALSGDVFHYNPKHIHHSDIHKHSEAGHEHLLLGLGPHSKHEILHRIVNGEHPVAIVERNEHGHEVHTALGTHTTAHVQHAHMMRNKSKNHTVHIEHPEKVLSERMHHIANRQAGGGVSNYPVFGGGYGQPMMPYSGGSSFVPGIGIVPGHGAPPAMQAPPTPAQFAASLGQGSGQSGLSGLKNLGPGLFGKKGASSSTTPAGWSASGADENQVGPGIPAGTDDSGNVSSEDEAGMESDEWARGGPVGIANYAGGGNVEPMPMSLDQMADAMKRLSSAGMLNKPAAQDFASARLNQLGISPSVSKLPPPSYTRGGVAGYQDGGAPDDQTAYQVAGLEPGDAKQTMADQPPPRPSEDEALAYGPAKDTGVAGGAPMITDADQHVMKDVPLPTPKPTIEPARMPGANGVVGNAVPVGGPTPDHHAAANAASSLFSQKEQEYGLPDGYLAHTAHIESNGNPHNRNELSGAAGLFQFIPSTAKQYGLSNPYDPIASTDAAARLGRDNAAALKAALGRDPTASELYLAHQQGVKGAIKLLSNPDARAGDLVGNKAVAWNGGNPNATAADFTNMWDKRFGGAGTSNVKLASLNGMPTSDTTPPPRGTQVAQAAPSGVANKWGPDNPLWESLIAAGAGMLASRSPFAGVAIGEGVGAGLGSYQQQRQIAESNRLNQSRVDLESRKIQDEADYREKMLKQQAQMHSDTLAEQRRVHEENLMKPLPGFNPDTHMPDYQQRMPNGDIYWTGTGYIFSGPHRGQNISEVPPDNYFSPGTQPAQPNAPRIQPQSPNPNAPSTQGNPNVQQAVFHPDRDGTYRVAAQWAGDSDPATGKTTKQYDYLDTDPTHMPQVEKGMPVPDPKPFGSTSTDAIKIDAHQWLMTGALPPGTRGNNPMGQTNYSYQQLVKNYGSAIAHSLGMEPEDIPEMRKKFPLAAKFAVTKDGQQVVSGGTAIDHIADIEDLYSLMSKQGMLSPGDNQTLNAIKAKISKEFGGEAVTGLYAAANIVGPEVMKVIVPGGGGVNERGDITKEWTPINSPGQFHMVAETMKRLMADQIAAKERVANNLGVKPEEFKQLIGDHAYKVLTDIRQGKTTQATAPAGGGTAPTARVPTDFDRNWVKSHPEAIDRFRKTFGQEP